MEVSRTLLDQFMNETVNLFDLSKPESNFYNLQRELIEGCYAQGILLPNWIGNRPVLFTHPFSSDPLVVVHRNINVSSARYDLRPMCTAFPFESIQDISIKNSILEISLKRGGYKGWNMDDFDEEGEELITRLLMKKQV